MKKITEETLRLLRCKGISKDSLDLEFIDEDTHKERIISDEKRIQKLHKELEAKYGEIDFFIMKISIVVDAKKIILDWLENNISLPGIYDVMKTLDITHIFAIEKLQEIENGN